MAASVAIHDDDLWYLRVNARTVVGAAVHWARSSKPNAISYILALAWVGCAEGHWTLELLVYTTCPRNGYRL